MQILFHRIGFSNIPIPVQYGIAGTIFAAPVLLMCYVIFCMKDEVIDASPVKRAAVHEGGEAAQKKEAQKPASGRNREKLE